MKATIAVLLAATAIASAADTSLVRFSEFVGTSIRTQDGATLGQVHDVVLDRDTGRIRFALQNKGDSLGIAKQIAPIPWEVMSVQAEKKWVVNVDRSNLPGFEPAGAPGIDVQTESSSGNSLQDTSKAPKDSNPAADKDED